MNMYSVNVSFTQDGIFCKKVFHIFANQAPNEKDFKTWYEKRFPPLKISDVKIISAVDMEAEAKKVKKQKK